MIRCLCLNPSLDKTVAVPEFFWDAPNRVRLLRADVSGKGVNVAQAIGALQGQAMLYSFDFSGSPLAAKARDAIIPCRLVSTCAELRVNLKIWDEKRQHTLEVNEPGAQVTEENKEKIISLFLQDCQEGDWAVLSGSIPPGIEKTVYRDLCGQLQQKGCHVAVDCDGAALEAALEAGPDLIKPNAQEFFHLTGADPKNRAEILGACRKIRQRGVKMICLSLGPEGAVLSCGEGDFFCPAADVKVLSLQGAGDSMLAGLLLALRQGRGPEEALRYASAAAGASIMLPGTLLCRMEDTERIMMTLQTSSLSAASIS